ncbi:hypothetical protein TSUD_186830 [Trifolium subterraneum]|uniref:Uncharacterized protein n=1 Tax=Trifolium subterraneum TaxID=3900 RepID=A0A2Z6PDV0_TRISU|nr:hypothetical protein TSUD_186830 [Trifolium subterraneum]
MAADSWGDSKFVEPEVPIMLKSRHSAIEELAGMDVLCSDKTSTLTLNKLTVDREMIETLTPYMQSAAAKSSNSRKTNEKRYVIGDDDQGNFSVDLWKRAFKDALLLISVSASI